MDHNRRSAATDIALVGFVSSLIFFLNLGAPPLWDRDEPRNAGCAAEMAARGDWVVPVFNQQLRTHKPGLLYWLMMASYWCFGINEFGARFVSAALGVGTVLLTYAIGRRLDSPEVGRWAAIILASTIMFGVAARAATPDSLLIFCGTLAMALFVYGTFSNPANSVDAAEVALFPTSICWALGIYSAMGLGVLAKGPVGFVIPTAVIGMYLLIVRLDASGTIHSWRERFLWLSRLLSPLHFLRTCWSMRPVTAITTLSVVALPWYLWVTLRTDGVWLREFLTVHNVGRAIQVMEGHGGPPILYYVVAILVGFFPWSVFAIPVGGQIFAKLKQADARSHRATVLLLCWVAVYVGVFSLASTKLPSYVTPCYPALAVLAGTFLQRWRTAVEFRSLWLNAGFGNLILVGLLVSIGLPIAANYFLPGVAWLGLLGAIPLAGGTAAVWFQRRQRFRTATTVTGVHGCQLLCLSDGGCAHGDRFASSR